MAIIEATESKVKNFFNNYDRKIYEKGEFIIVKSIKHPEYIYYIEKGYVGQSKKNGPQNRITLNILKKKSFFPIILAIGSISNELDFEALNRVEVRIAPVADVIQFLKDNPDVLFRLTARLSRGLGGLLNHLETLILKEAKQQILDTLEVCTVRFGQKQGQYYKIDLEMTHKSLAGILGLSRETVTRELKKLIRDREIARKGKYFYMIVKNE